MLEEAWAGTVWRTSEPLFVPKSPVLCFASERKVGSGRGLSKFMGRSSTVSNRFTVPVGSTKHMFADAGCFRKKRFVQALQHVNQELAGSSGSPSAGSQSGWHSVSLSAVFLLFSMIRQHLSPIREALEVEAGLDTDQTGVWFWDDGSSDGEGSCFYWV